MAATTAAWKEHAMLYDVCSVGGGPAGLSAALTLGRARKRVLPCDAGPRRNAAAEHVHGFVTRDTFITSAPSGGQRTRVPGHGVRRRRR